MIYFTQCNYDEESKYTYGVLKKTLLNELFILKVRTSSYSDSSVLVKRITYMSAAYIVG